LLGRNPVHNHSVVVHIGTARSRAGSLESPRPAWERAYGAAIARELESRVEREVSIGALYATLGRLADKAIWFTTSPNRSP